MIAVETSETQCARIDVSSECDTRVYPGKLQCKRYGYNRRCVQAFVLPEPMGVIASCVGAYVYVRERDKSAMRV